MKLSFKKKAAAMARMLCGDQQCSSKPGHASNSCNEHGPGGMQACAEA